MSVLKRLMGIEKPRVSVHQFMAAIGEYKRGEITGAEAGALMSELDAAERAVVGTWLAGYTGTREQVHDVLLLGEDLRYSLADVKARGFAALDN